MPKVIKVTISDEEFERSFKVTPADLAGKNISFVEGMSRMLASEVLSANDEINVDATQVISMGESESRVFIHAITEVVLLGKSAMCHAEKEDKD